MIHFAHRTALALLWILLCSLSGNALAERRTETDGWYTWQVAGVANAPDWCCFEWEDSDPRTTACDLDRRDFGYGSHDEFSDDNDLVQIYAERKDGVLASARALSPSCPVTSQRTIRDLGIVSNEQSLDWLRPLALGHSQNRGSDALSAIALHAGDDAWQLLRQTASEHPTFAKRKNAVFWLGQVRIDESSALLKDMMRNDESEKMRHHTAFTYAQSDAQDRDAVLIGIVESTDLGHADRKNALFWLVQTESTDAIDYIQALLIADK